MTAVTMLPAPVRAPAPVAGPRAGDRSGGDFASVLDTAASGASSTGPAGPAGRRSSATTTAADERSTEGSRASDDDTHEVDDAPADGVGNLGAIAQMTRVAPGASSAGPDVVAAPAAATAESARIQAAGEVQAGGPVQAADLNPTGAGVTSASPGPAAAAATAGQAVTSTLPSVEVTSRSPLPTVPQAAGVPQGAVDAGPGQRAGVDTTSAGPGPAGPAGQVALSDPTGAQESAAVDPERSTGHPVPGGGTDMRGASADGAGTAGMVPVAAASQEHPSPLDRLMPSERVVEALPVAATVPAAAPVVSTSQLADAGQAAVPATRWAPAEVPARPLAEQLGGRLTALRGAGEGQHVLTMRVEPESIGPVRVVAHIGVEGVRIELLGATDQARDALRAALPDLRRDLASAGFPADLGLGSGNGTGSQRGQAAAGDTGQGGQPGRNDSTSNRDRASADAARAAADQALGGDPLTRTGGFRAGLDLIV